ncbi:hypothetical protein CBR_g357 [Chara braunii]|uniref:Uncharacterized protein n=1 Tax=Chara braunii TaxID=69332 RepID=A0A388JQC9_CHABU|nr:hypothetical protein CBR_g357 [Chara braunii]|eukprot:GBG60026.1 hypothetical protein CBR_g357 [Chara braunii]
MVWRLNDTGPSEERQGQSSCAIYSNPYLDVTATVGTAAPTAAAIAVGTAASATAVPDASMVWRLDDAGPSEGRQGHNSYTSRGPSRSTSSCCNRNNSNHSSCRNSGMSSTNSCCDRRLDGPAPRRHGTIRWSGALTTPDHRREDMGLERAPAAAATTTTLTEGPPF